MTRTSKLTIFLSLLFILSGTLIAQERTWQNFSPRTGTWSVLAPGIMSPDNEALDPQNKQGTYSFADSNGFFAVVYKDFSRLNFLFGKKSHFTKQRDAVIKANKGTLIKDEEFTNGGITGREVQIRMPDNRVIGRESNVKPQYRVQRFRMFFQGNRFYMLLAVLPEEQINSTEINNYLNSFVLK